MRTALKSLVMPPKQRKAVGCMLLLENGGIVDKAKSLVGDQQVFAKAVFPDLLSELRQGLALGVYTALDRFYVCFSCGQSVKVGKCQMLAFDVPQSLFGQHQGSRMFTWLRSTEIKSRNRNLEKRRQTAGHRSEWRMERYYKMSQSRIVKAVRITAYQR